MQTRSQGIIDTLRDRILCGAITPGTHLQEVPLAEEMNVSRTPVRTALAALASEGLLQHQTKRGYFVRGFTIDDIEGAHEVRANLEGLACRLAAERGLSAEDEQVLRGALADGDRILASGRLRDEDRGRWTEMNDIFHQRIIDAAGSPLLAELIDRTHRVPLASSRVIHWYDFHAVKGSHMLHHRIFNYISGGKPTNAEGLMREHIMQALEQIRLRFDGIIDSDSDVVSLAQDVQAGAAV